MKTYLRHRIHNVIDIKELTALEYLDFEGKYKNYAEAHDFWELCYVLEGTVQVFLDDIEMTLGARQLLLIPPNKKHRFFSEDGNESSAFVACFDSFSQALLPISGNIFDADDMQQDCMGKIIADCRDTFRMNESGLMEVLPNPLFGGQQVIWLLLEYLLIGLVRRMSADENSAIVFINDENYYEDIVNLIIRFLRKNVCQRLTLDVICDRFGYSKSFLCKVFKEQTGQTLISYFNLLKIEEAKRMLKQGTRTIADISDTLGFHEAKYFGTIFKKTTGMTPMDYRNYSDIN